MIPFAVFLATWRETVLTSAVKGVDNRKTRIRSINSMTYARIALQLIFHVVYSSRKGARINDQKAGAHPPNN
jgi:hypothetical protein